MSQCPYQIEAQTVSRRFSGRWVVSGVNVRLRKGRSLLIAGHNGAGKTTLLRMLASMLRPSDGRVLIDGVDVAENAQSVRQNVSMLAQRNGLYLELSALQNLRIVQRLLGHAGDDAPLRRLLQRVRLDEHADAPARTFSAGMKKRLAIARLLLQDTEIVMFDEPYGQLDPSGFEFIDGLVRELIDAERTVLMVTHLVPRASALVESGLLLAGGKPIWAGPASELPSRMQESAPQ